MADLILYNGNIITFLGGQPFHWIAIKNRIITQMGFKEDYLHIADNNTELIDLKEKTVLPGFYDSHVHLVQTGLNSISVDLSNATSFNEVFKFIKDYCDITPKDTLVRAAGLDETKLKEKRLPTRYEIDKISPDHPVWINRKEYHTSILNSLALHRFTIPLNLKGVLKNEANVPTGVLTHTANALVRKQILESISNKVRFSAVNNTLKDAIAKGVTTINAMEGGYTFHDKDAEFIYDTKDDYPIDIILFYQTINVDKVMEKNLNRIGGSIFLDGSFGSRTAALCEPYKDDDTKSGILYYTQEELNAFVLKCYENNIQLGTHAIGELAIEQIISAHEFANSIYPNKKLRHRIEHFELPSNDHINRARKLGLIASVQPTYEYFWGGKGKMYDKRLGEERTMKTNPYKSMIHSDLIVCGGSDSDVTPINPLLGIYSAVNHPNENERVTVLEAIKIFTINSAYAVFEEDKKGSIEVGKYADLVVLNENPLTIDSKKIKDISIVATIKEGNILYEDGLRPDTY